MRLVGLVIGLLGMVENGGAAVITLNSGPANLLIESNAGAFGVSLMLTNGDATYQQTNPMAVEIVTTAGVSNWLTAAYSSAQNLGGGVCQCMGSVTSLNGSVFTFTDTYKDSTNCGGFEVDRSVQVAVANPLDAGFATKLTFQRTVAGQMADYDFFMPAVWYGTNAGVTSISLANTMTDNYYWYREDRLPLPLFMLREKDNGATFAVAHVNPNGGTFAGENYLPRIIDGRMQFASLGMENHQLPAVGMIFPGTEGERSLIQGGSTSKTWALRSHPVQAGFTQTYTLVMRLTVETNFVSAMQNTWVSYYTLFNPTNYNCNLSEIYSNGIGILNRYWESINGAAGEPFRVPLSGVITNPLDYNYQMGFTGMEPDNAALLVREGWQTTNATLRSEGEQMLNFWASNGLTQAGCPLTWYDPYPQTWRGDATAIRVATDGMLGLLWGWKQEYLHGVNQTNWLAAGTHFGDWIVSQQGADGSMPREFAWQDDAVTDSAKSNTAHIIRYLVELYMATGIPAYRTAALAAGGYVYTNTVQNLNYQGGAATDGDTVPDKEAASLALRACTALYDLTQDTNWLNAAVQTADYYATWIYAWNLPIPPGQTGLGYPVDRQTTGLSVIATGQSGCDSYAATDGFEVYRLYLFTGDPQLLKLAQMMLYNTKQGLNWNAADPIPGFGDPAMINEAMTVVGGPRGTGVGYYLPWQTANYLEPLINLRDTFGAYDLNQLQAQPLALLQSENAVYGATRGYARPQMVLAAAAGNRQNWLSWTAWTNAASYNLQRATVSGGPFTTIASLTGTSYTDTNVVNGTIYYYLVSAVTGAGLAGTSAPVSATPASPLTALYPFEGNVLDASGNNHNGVNFGATFVAGKIGVQAAQFKGGGYVRIPLSIGSSGFTIAMWVKSTDTGGPGSQWYAGEGLVDGEVAGVTNDFGTVLLNGSFALGIGNPDTTVASLHPINDGTWHHVAGSWDSATGAMKVYVDGVLDNLGIGATAPRNAPPNLRIGSIQTGVVGGFFNGAMDDVRLYSQVLTQPQIAALIPQGPLNLAPAPTGGQLLLSWPAWADEYGLLATTNLRPPVIWTPVTNVVQNTGTNVNLTLATTNAGACFYRLQLP